MSGDGTTVRKTDHYGYDCGTYTPVTVRDKDTGKQFVINFKNARITGNEASWTIKDGVLCDKDGKPIKDNIMEVTKYQAAIIKAADYDGDGFLDDDDYSGGAFGSCVSDELQKAESAYRVSRSPHGYTYDKDGRTVPMIEDDAEASNGFFTAHVENASGDKGRLIIDIRTEEDLQREAQRKAEAEALFRKEEKPWWKFW